MKVKELIKKLDAMNPEFEIWFENSFGVNEQIKDAGTGRVCSTRDYDCCVLLSVERDVKGI